LLVLFPYTTLFRSEPGKSSYVKPVFLSTCILDLDSMFSLSTGRFLRFFLRGGLFPSLDSPFLAPVRPSARLLGFCLLPTPSLDSLGLERFTGGFSTSSSSSLSSYSAFWYSSLP